MSDEISLGGLVLGLTLVYASAVVLGNLLADALLWLLDARRR